MAKDVTKNAVVEQALPQGDQMMAALVDEPPADQAEEPKTFPPGFCTVLYKAQPASIAVSVLSSLGSNTAHFSNGQREAYILALRIVTDHLKEMVESK
jgi:hypothetical protein